MTILQCRGVSKNFGGLIAVDDLNFSISKGEIVGLIGPNGAGKTTLFNVIAGLYRPSAGDIFFNNENITNTPPHRICKKGIARTFQVPQPFNGLSVLENIKIGLYFGNRHRRNGKTPEDIARIVGLEPRKNELVENLTLSEQKRVELAKSISTNPKLLLLDEVGCGLNPAEQDNLSDLIMNICKEANITVIVVEHVMRTVMKLSERIIVLNRGQILADDVPESIGKNKKVIEAYLGIEYARHTDS